MERKIKKLLKDILDSIISINEYLGEDKSFAKYERDKKLRRAVEREFEIVGEAMRRLSELTELHEITDPQQIIGLRNKVIHGYDVIEDGLIWGIIINHLPKLKSEVELLLNKE